MSSQTRRQAGILLLVLPTVIYGGVSILSMLVNDPTYPDNHLRESFWRAGHAHAGVLLVLSLVALLYLDEATLSAGWKRLAIGLIPSSAILVPAGFFFSMLRPSDTQPNGFIYLAYAGAVVLALGLLILGIGLVRKPQPKTIADK